MTSLKNSAISTDQLRSEQVKTHRDAATEYKTWASKQDKMVAASAKVGVYEDQRTVFLKVSSLTQATRELTTNVSEKCESNGEGVVVNKADCASVDALRPCFP